MRAEPNQNVAFSKDCSNMESIRTLTDFRSQSEVGVGRSKSEDVHEVLLQLPLTDSTCSDATTTSIGNGK